MTSYIPWKHNFSSVQYLLYIPIGISISYVYEHFYFVIDIHNFIFKTQKRWNMIFFWIDCRVLSIHIHNIHNKCVLDIIRKSVEGILLFNFIFIKVKVRVMKTLYKKRYMFKGNMQIIISYAFKLSSMYLHYSLDIYKL